MTTIFHPELHPVFELLGYIFGFVLYRAMQRKLGDFLSDQRRWILIAATALGALVGSRVLGLLEEAPVRGLRCHDFLLPGGKTIVGGLLGGWLAVEVVKLGMGLRQRTGDLFAVPICVGVAIGRAGCFLAGLADDTYGKATTLPWGVDFGDGVKRHPTQLYEIAFLVALAAVLWQVGKRPHRKGAVFRLFLAAYLGWRLMVDFLKPQPLVHGLNVIQWACVAGLMAVAAGELRRRESGRA